MALHRATAQSREPWIEPVAQKHPIHFLSHCAAGFLSLASRRSFLLLETLPIVSFLSAASPSTFSRLASSRKMGVGGWGVDFEAKGGGVSLITKQKTSLLISYWLEYDGRRAERCLLCFYPSGSRISAPCNVDMKTDTMTE